MIENNLKKGCHKRISQFQLMANWSVQNLQKKQNIINVLQKCEGIQNNTKKIMYFIIHVYDWSHRTHRHIVIQK